MKKITGQKRPISKCRGCWDSYVEWLSLECVETLDPPNDPFDNKLLLTLITSMKQDGWAGPPLLLLIYEDGEKLLLNGSHRIAAAKQAGLDEIPFLIISGAKWNDKHETPFQTAYNTAIGITPSFGEAIAALSDEKLNLKVEQK